MLYSEQRNLIVSGEVQAATINLLKETAEDSTLHHYDSEGSCGKHPSRPANASFDLFRTYAYSDEPLQRLAFLR